ncbi:E3 SUMO-protein ligase ZBED1-like [Misgurnus anguillicaudatus]|uniref:E3 SUMO-protein ligase ZBED1-like n=1 Tax=Misgurnus anguillicaudatus TaxID=75329 RepID=UPI003CCF4B3A
MLRRATFVHNSTRRRYSPYGRADRQWGHSESVQNLKKAEWDRVVQQHPVLGLIISGLLPHTFVGEPGFLQFFQSIKYNCLPTNFILSNLKTLHIISTGFVQDQLERVNNVALSCELWKTTTNKTYMTTTCHLIDDAWTQMSFVLETTPLPEAYTPKNVVVQLLKIAQKWKIKSKIKVVITNVDGIKREIKNCGWEYIPCFAHTLDVVFRATLEASSDWKELAQRCCCIAQYFSQNVEAQAQLKEAQTKLWLSPDNLIESNADRWLSTLKMLERITEQHKAIREVLISSNNDLFLTESENEDIKKAIACLKVFQGVMTAADTAKRYHLLSNVIPQVEDMKQKLSELELSGNEFAKELAESFIHFGEIKENDWLTLSTALDVRYRDNVLSDRVNLTCIKIKIRGEMLETRVSLRQPNNLDEALNRYLNKEILRRDWDPHAFWKFPKDEDWHLSEVARKYLTAVSTAMPADVAFDTEKASLVASRRSSLDPQHLNMMLFLNGNSFELSATKSREGEIYNLFEVLNI